MKYPTQQTIPNRFLVSFDGFQRLTLKERLLILIGWNLTATVRVAVDRRNESVKGAVKVTLTKQTSPAGQIQEQVTQHATRTP